MNNKNKDQATRFIGYCRVSTKKQSTDLQIQQLKGAGCSKIFEDVISGIIFERKGLSALLKYVKKGDIIVVYRIDRLGRLNLPLLKLFETITSKGAYLKTLSSNIIDPENPHDMFLFHMKCAMAEQEYKIINERTTNGRLKAHKMGIYGGRPHVFTPATIQRAQYLYNKGKRVSDIAKELKVSRRTFYNMLKKDADSFIPRTKINNGKKKTK